MLTEKSLPNAHIFKKLQRVHVFYNGMLLILFSNTPDAPKIRVAAIAIPLRNVLYERIADCGFIDIWYRLV